MAQKLFNTFHVEVTPKYLQQYIDRLTVVNKLKFTGDKMTCEKKATVFIGNLSHGICSWTIYMSNGDTELGMFTLEKLP